MKERPILFSGPMVRAIREGRKTQTRRMIKDQSIGERFSHMTDNGMAHLEWVGQPRCGSGVWDVPEYSADVACPYGQPGDRLWVRETWCEDPEDDGTWAYTQYMGCKGSPMSDIPAKFRKPEHCIYREDWDGPDLIWRPSIHMPRWASRILLEIVSVRVERLKDISEEDADAEGCERLDFERYDKDWKLCPKCGGTRLHNALGGNGGVIFDVDCVECDTYVKRFRHLWESINGAGSWEANPWVWCVEFKRVEGGTK